MHKWKEISKEQPVHGKLIWVWDIHHQHKFLIRYMGSKDIWLETKDNTKFPIWSYFEEL